MAGVLLYIKKHLSRRGRRYSSITLSGGIPVWISKWFGNENLCSNPGFIHFSRAVLEKLLRHSLPQFPLK